MMKIVFVFAAAFVSILAQARDIALLEALSKGANAQVRLNVIDQDGLPVPQAKVFGGFAAGSGFTNLEDAETARLSRLAYKQNLEFEQKRKENRKSLWPF